MGFLRGPGSLQFKWAATKALFPELTSTYYKNTGRPRRSRGRRGRVIDVYPDWYTAAPTAEERVWITRFATFCRRGDALKNNRSPAAHRQLYLLMFTGGTTLDQFAEFFGRQGHTKDFADAFLRFVQKVEELFGVSEKYISHDERVQIVEKTNNGQISVDLDTWKEIPDKKV